MIFGITFFLGVLAMLLVVFVIKNEVTYYNLGVIYDAILEYQLNNILHPNDNTNCRDVDYSDTKSYERVLFNLFDWGYKHIITDKEKYKLIEPYIKK